MKVFSILSLATAAIATTVSYDTGYDDAGRSMNVVSCSDGAHGLTTRYGWKTQGQVSKFPYIGGSSDVPGWNSPNCGECLEVSYKGKTIHMLVVDHTLKGVNMGKRAMDALTGNQATKLGRIEATVKKVAVSNCGISHPKRELEFTA